MNIEENTKRNFNFTNMQWEKKSNIIIHKTFECSLEIKTDTFLIFGFLVMINDITLVMIGSTVAEASVPPGGSLRFFSVWHTFYGVSFH